MARGTLSGAGRGSGGLLETFEHAQHIDPQDIPRFAKLGVIPAMQLARTDPQDAFRSGTQSAGRSRMRNILVGVEAGVAVLVLLIAAFFLRNFASTHSTDTGFAREGVLLAGYDLSGRGFDLNRAKIVTRTLLEKLRALPGVETAAIASAVPLDIHGMAARSFVLEGRARTAIGVNEALTYNVTPDYFRVMGIPLIEGADFRDLADPADARQAIVNAEFVRRYLDGGAAIGRRLEIGGKSYAIAGVVRNSLYEAFGEPPKPIMYFSFRDRFTWSGQIHLRTNGTEASLAPELRQVVRAIDPAIQVYDVRTLADHIDRNLFLRRIPARIFAVLGPLILFLAAMGIYAVVAYTVARRTVEIGVRRALGASDRRVIAEIISDGMKSVVIGTGVGWLPAVAINLHLSRGVAVGPVILIGVPVLLLGVAALACWLPARRAARVDPMVALRAE